MKELTTYLWFAAMSTTGFAEGAECSLMNFSPSLMKANLLSTARPLSALLAASRSVGTGYTFWETASCIKHELWLSARVDVTIHQDETHIESHMLSQTSFTCGPFMLLFFLTTLQRVQSWHPTVCKHMKRTCPAVSQKPHLVLVYTIPPLFL